MGNPDFSTARLKYNVFGAKTQVLELSLRLIYHPMQKDWDALTQRLSIHICITRVAPVLRRVYFYDDNDDTEQFRISIDLGRGAPSGALSATSTVSSHFWPDQLPWSI